MAYNGFCIFLIYKDIHPIGIYMFKGKKCTTTARSKTGVLSLALFSCDIDARTR